ncbi:MAG: type II toxin-antitoxin system VapC family toxin [Variibacter sp.]|nr:type II toxin-antitoxin system VapC family toxin [Variibacter sp.]
MSLIVDASIAVKWFADEVGSAEARALGTSGDALVAPDLVIAELGSALWKKCRLGAIARMQAMRAMEQAPEHFDALFEQAELRSQALELALDLNHPIYDCFYLALALRENAPVVTADARLRAAAEKARVAARMI